MLRRLETKLLGDVGRLEAKVDDLNTHVNTQLAPLQKNRRDLEQGLRGLTELSQDVHTNLAAVQSDDSALKGLAQELKDQQEAMDALMDMLEKTITVEVCCPPSRSPCTRDAMPPDARCPLLARAMPFPSLRAR